MEKFLTTANVPPEFLQAAFLVGRVPRVALASDPRISYALYVPRKHYNPNPSKPADGDAVAALPKLPLLVSVHGTRRNLSSTYDALIPFAESTPCGILSPLFPAGLDSPIDLDSYMFLRSKTLRSDLALLAMLDVIARRWPGIETEKVYLMGFSGGGQFAHRFLYLYPERIAAISVGAPGSVTLLDEEKNWPEGIADTKLLFDRQVDKELIRQVHIQLVIGGADVKIHGEKAFWVWLQTMKMTRKSDEAPGDGDEKNIMVPMTQGRLETLQKLRTAWKEDGIESGFEVVDGVAHDGEGVRECVLQFMKSRMQ
jgi:hypothetical protein